MIEIGGTQLQVGGSLVKIARVDGEKFLFADNPDAIVDSLRDSKHGIDIFTFIQKVSETSPKYTYPTEWDNLAVLGISTFDEWWSNVGAKTRNMARQAEKKGVVIREVPFSEALVKGIWQIYNEVPIRQGRKFPHFGKNFGSVYEEESTYLDRSVFIGAFLGDKLIGFIKLLWDRDGSQVGLLNIVSLIEHRDKAPNNALIAKAVQFSAEKKFPYLVYSNFSYGKRSRDSLSDFKAHNAFQRVDLPRYFVPLTVVGSVALRLGFHKRIVERVPEQMIVRLKEIRSSWHGRKVPSAPARTKVRV